MPAQVLSPSEIERIRGVLRAHGVSHAALFGSFARRTAGEHSDIDILVEFSGPTGLLDVAAIELEIGDLLGRPVEVITYPALNPRIREQVLREQVSIL